MRIRWCFATCAAVAGLVSCSDAAPPVQPVGPPVDCKCISPPTVVLNQGDVIQFAVTTVPGETWHWSSSDSIDIPVDQTGKIRGLGVGSATITALSSLNHLAKASVLVQALPRDPPVTVVITGVNQLPANSPANLAALAGTVEVAFSSTLTPSVTSAGLIITRPSGDTTVSAVNPPASGTMWNGALRWNTADKTATGSSAFPNGSYSLRVFVTTASGNTSSTANLHVTVANP